MKTKWIGATLGVTLMLSGSAFANVKDKKLCKDLEELKSSLTTLDNLPPEATLGEFKASVGEVRSAGQAVAKEAAKDKDAQNLNMAINDLRQSVSSLPANSSEAKAKAQIEPQLNEVRTATRQFAVTYCHK